MAWRAHPACPKHLVGALERHINALPAAYLLPPQTGEIFDSIASCERRIRGYSMAQGFDIVLTGGGTRVAPGARFECCYHGDTTRNWRHLEDHVEKDEEGKVTSERQREGTTVGQLNCQWSVRVTWKDIGKRGSGNKAFILTVKSDDHVHSLSTNPLSFPRHRQALDEWQALIQTARKHRQAIIPYSDSRRVLESEEFGVTITAREYYNSVRKMVADKDQPQTIDGLLVALQEEGFVYRTRVEVEEDDDGKPIKRKMVQIWFAHKQQLQAAARFCSDWLLVIDGTFNTNKYRLPLLIAVGVLNSGRTFPVCFSYCPSESDESFGFVWDSLKQECFKSDQNLSAPPPPRIFLDDQAAGLISSVLKHWPEAQIQSCDWYAVEAMKARYRKSGYKKEEIDGV
jgi:MULE transposase domain